MDWSAPLHSRSPEETWAIAAALVRELPARAVIALHGDLGAGKTCFVQGLARALGITEPVTSPTFTIMNEFHGERYLCHIDLYRLGGPDEVLALGFDEYLEADGIVAIEWPERAADILPAHTINVQLAVDDDTPDARMIEVCLANS